MTKTSFWMSKANADFIVQLQRTTMACWFLWWGRQECVIMLQERACKRTCACLCLQRQNSWYKNYIIPIKVCISLLYLLRMCISSTLIVLALSWSWQIEKPWPRTSVKRQSKTIVTADHHHPKLVHFTLLRSANFDDFNKQHKCILLSIKPSRKR